jgi:hypothetical protein
LAVWRRRHTPVMGDSGDTLRVFLRAGRTRTTKEALVKREAAEARRVSAGGGLCLNAQPTGPILVRPVLAEIYLCHACSCQEIEVRRRGGVWYSRRWRRSRHAEPGSRPGAPERPSGARCGRRRRKRRRRGCAAASGRWLFPWGARGAQPTVQARFWLLSLPAVQFSPGCMPAAAAKKVPLNRATFQYGQYRGTKGWERRWAGWERRWAG